MSTTVEQAPGLAPAGLTTFAGEIVLARRI